MRLLLVEDDLNLGGAVQAMLGRAGFAIDWVRTSAECGRSLGFQRYDLVVLDLGLPDEDGEIFLRRIRLQHSRLPVVVVTARAAVHDRIRLLDMGADDYLVKPFDVHELIARMRSVLRRSPSEPAEDDAYTHGSLKLNPARRLAQWNGEAVALTRKEYCVLETLVRRKNEVLTRSQLEEALYGWGEEVDSNAIEVYIHFLRRKFGADLIHTLRGVGYQMAPLRERV